ncbi:MAG: carboxymuconolactone decarboxylase family protein [Pseudorhodobacter sp.]|nr:carboxymuconolactone decarboxylase family protein [Pseudorhodobacter sp.]
MKRNLTVVKGGLLALAMGAAVPALADEAADAARKDIEATLGMMPSMLATMPDLALPGAWAEIKGLQLNPASALDGKTKELLGLAGASQIPCTYCIYFHTLAAKANGASEEEVREAVAMAAIVRHWSTMLNGMQVDQATFEAEINTLFAVAQN